jgi:hypothetical protein
MHDQAINTVQKRLRILGMTTSKPCMGGLTHYR